MCGTSLWRETSYQLTVLDFGASFVYLEAAWSVFRALWNFSPATIMMPRIARQGYELTGSMLSAGEREEWYVWKLTS